MHIRFTVKKIAIKNTQELEASSQIRSSSTIASPTGYLASTLEDRKASSELGGRMVLTDDP